MSETHNSNMEDRIVAALPFIVILGVPIIGTAVTMQLQKMGWPLAESYLVGFGVTALLILAGLVLVLILNGWLQAKEVIRDEW